MKSTTSKILATGFGVAALCAAAVPASASTFTQPGATTGAPAGANPPPGLYFLNAANFGAGGALNGVSGPGDTSSVGVEAAIFIWVPDWKILGATYSMSVGEPFVQVDTHGFKGTYLASPFNPFVSPFTLSWNLGNGFFASFGEVIYIPVAVVVNGTNTPDTSASGASFEQRAAISYINNGWIASVNTIWGLVTKDATGTQGNDYVNVDVTLAHEFGKWTVGVIGYGAWDLNGGLGTTGFTNSALGKNEEIGFGGVLAYDFGPVSMSLRLTHEFVNKGTTNYEKDDTRVWTTLFIPIWNPTTAPAPKPVIAKY